METGLHKPRYKLFHLVSLVAVLAFVFAILPAPVSLLAAGSIVVGAIICSVTDRITLIEWFLLAAIGSVLVALTLPAMTSNHTPRNRAKMPAIQTTTPPIPINKL